MGAESIDPEGAEKLFGYIKDKRRDLKRFKEGFYLTIQRNIKNKVITEEEASNLIAELESKNFAGSFGHNI